MSIESMEERQPICVHEGRWYLGMNMSHSCDSGLKNTSPLVVALGVSLFILVSRWSIS